MSNTFRKMDTQLKTWRERIELMAARDPQSGDHAGAPSPQRIAELRALHAAAQTAFTGFRTAAADERAGLKPQTVLVWNALAAAVKTPKPAN